MPEKNVEIIMQAISQYLRETDTADANIKILDVGAGNCWLLYFLPLKCTKVAIDISPHHQFDDDNFARFLAEDFVCFVLAGAVPSLSQMPGNVVCCNFGSASHFGGNAHTIIAICMVFLAAKASFVIYF